MNLDVIILFSTFFLNSVDCFQEMDDNLIKDILNVMKTSAVMRLTCRTKYKEIKLLSYLMQNNKMIQFASLEEIPRTNDYNTIFLVDLNCPNISSSLKMYEEKNLFRPQSRWVFYDNNTKRDQNPDILSYIEDINILLNSEVMFLKPQNNGYEITLVYKISNESSWRIEFFGKWTQSDGLQKSKEWTEITALRRKNVNRNRISICYVLTDPDSINHLKDRVNDHVDTITKVNYLSTNQLLDFMNASRSYLYTNTWGYKNNGTWNGMTGYLVRGEVEIGGSPMFFTSQRMSVVEYISSPTPTRSKFVFLQPKLSYENNLFLLSFQQYLWYGATCLIILLFIFLFIITIWEWKKMAHDSSRSTDATVLRPSIVDIAILIFAATCQQGSNVELKGSLGRVVLLLLFLALTFLYTSYSANIVALLQSSSSQIRTLEDLLHSRLKFAVDDTVYNRYYFSIETDPIRKAIYETKIAPPGVQPRFMAMDEGVKKIQKGLFAFHMEIGVGYKFVGKYFREGEKCGLKEIQYLQVIDPWLAVRKDSVYLEIFKIGTKRLQEHGLQQRENRLLYMKKPKCSGKESNFVSVSIVDCYPAFLIMSYGAVFSGAIMCIELLYKRRNELIKFLCTPHKFETYTDKLYPKS